MQCLSIGSEGGTQGVCQYLSRGIAVGGLDRPSVQLLDREACFRPFGQGEQVQRGEPERAALAETYLLAGRIEFFDLCDADRAQQTLLRALQAAGEADAPLLGPGILAHTAFIPGWAGDRDAAVERMVAARTCARRGPASAELLAWLDAVEAECETRCGHTRTALHLIGHAESVLQAGSEHETRSGSTDSLRSDSPRSRGTPN